MERALRGCVLSVRNRLGPAGPSPAGRVRVPAPARSVSPQTTGLLGTVQDVFFHVLGPILFPQLSEFLAESCIEYPPDFVVNLNQVKLMQEWRLRYVKDRAVSGVRAACPMLGMMGGNHNSAKVSGHGKQHVCGATLDGVPFMGEDDHSLIDSQGRKIRSKNHQDNLHPTANRIFQKREVGADEMVRGFDPD